MKLKAMALGLLFCSNSLLALGDVGVPSYIATAAQTKALENAVLRESKSAKKVVCQNAILVPTFGINTATAAACILDNSEYQLSCKNDMLGSTGGSVRLHPDMSVESELRLLIMQQCTGG